MTDLTISKIDESNVHVDFDNRGVGMNLSDYFSYFAENYRHNPKFKYSSWDGKIRMYNGKTRTMPLGLLTMLGSFCRDMGYTANDYTPLIKPPVQFSEDELRQYADEFTAWDGDDQIEELHWWQKESFIKAYQHGRLIIESATSSGKSLTQAMISRFYIDRIRKSTDKIILIIVPKTDLVVQMRDDFLNYRTFDRDDIQCFMSGEDKDLKPGTKVVISTWQSAANLEASFFNSVGMLMVDECHTAEGKTIQDLALKKCRNVPWKFGLTGSLKDGKSSALLLRGIFGSVYKAVSTKDMIAEGKATPMEIRSVHIQYPEEKRQQFKKLKVKYPVEIEWVEKYQPRTEFIARMATKLADRDENVLMLFQHQNHGDALYEAVSRLGGKVVLVHGNLNAEQKREAAKVRERAEAEDGLIIIASYKKYSTGISIKKLHHVIFASPLKAKITIMQSIGRGLRKHLTKKAVMLWDVVDDLSVRNTRKNAKNKYSYMNYGMKHFIERAKLYMEEGHPYKVKKWDIDA